MDGAAGPSGLDVAAWKRLCTSFKTASADLCNSLASTARRICSCYVDPRGLSSFVACRLIALDKCPGVRPIGIGETVRRIRGRTIAIAISDDIQAAAGPLQVCAGHLAGCEAAYTPCVKCLSPRRRKQCSLSTLPMLSIRSTDRQPSGTSTATAPQSLRSSSTHIERTSSYSLMERRCSPKKEQPRAIHSPWQCMPLRSFHSSTNLKMKRRSRSGLQMMLQLEETLIVSRHGGITLLI